MTVSSTTDMKALVDVEIYAVSGGQVQQQAFDQEVFTTGAPRTFAVPLKTGLPPGQYVVKIGVFSTGWGTLLAWNDSATRFDVSSGGAKTRPATATRPPATATRPPATATRPPATATRPPATATPLPTATGTPALGTASAPKLLFGVGPEADQAVKARLVQEAPVRMLTSWFNGPADLSWMAGWRHDLVPQAYGRGDALHLIVYTGGGDAQISTAYGTACGRPYPLSDRFLDDMRQVAQTFAGQATGPPLYVTLFTEFQTYACTDNAWNPDAQTNAYYRALKDRYLATVQVFRQNAPNAKVSLGWGGWQTRWDDPATGAGRSMIPYFADVMRASDFQSFQAMEGSSNVEDIRAMSRALGQYGPVLLAHYLPDGGSQAVYDADMRAVLSDAYLAEVRAAGLFGMSFMADPGRSAGEQTYQFIKGAVQRYGTAP